MRTKILGLGLVCLFLFSFPNCKKEAPTTPPLPTVQSITVISSSDLLYIGTSETFTATVKMSDGSTQAITEGIWGTSNETIATVGSSTGLVTIVGSGNVNIFVDYKGKRGKKRIRGLPNYQGVWSGSYYITSCSCTGDFAGANFCNNFNINQVLPTDLNLIQEDDRVEGQFFLGTLSADTSGSVQNSGKLILTGTIREDIFTIDVSWQLQSTTPGEIFGDLNQLWRASGFSGDGRIKANIRNLDRTSTMIMALPSRMQRLVNPKLEDLIHLLFRR